MAANSLSAQMVPGLEEIRSIARSHGAEPYLWPMVEMTHRVFPDIRSLRIHWDFDLVTDDPDDWRIAFIVEAACSADEAAAGIGQWYQNLFESCPASAACYFRLDLRVVA